MSNTDAVTLMITHEVSDYNQWLDAFQAHEPARSKAGIQIKNIYQAVDNPNRITVQSEAPSAEAAAAFMSHPDNRAAMANAGLLGAPSVQVLRQA